MANKYTYSLDDFPYDKADGSRLSLEIQSSAIVTALNHINVGKNNCDVWFKAELSSGDETILDGLVAAHSGEVLPEEAAPTMSDGRPLVRADTRPLETQTYFTMSGDTVSGIGDGKILKWNFAHDEDVYDSNDYENGPTVVSGMKCKVMEVWFNDPVYLKDGSLYFQNASFGSYVCMYITVPAGNYYPNDAGPIPASALGLPGDQMYAYASKKVLYACYVMKHHMVGDCTMGDELNAEGAQVDAIPAGWYITGIICTDEDNNNFRGFGSLEMYRAHTVVLPGGAPGGE